jgi:hypothetical protein
LPSLERLPETCSALCADALDVQHISQAEDLSFAARLEEMMRNEAAAFKSEPCECPAQLLFHLLFAAVAAKRNACAPLCSQEQDRQLHCSKSCAAPAAQER